MPRTFNVSMELEYPASPNTMAAVSDFMEILEAGKEKWAEDTGSIPPEIIDLHFYKGE